MADPAAVHGAEGGSGYTWTPRDTERVLTEAMETCKQMENSTTETNCALVKSSQVCQLSLIDLEHSGLVLRFLWEIVREYFQGVYSAFMLHCFLSTTLCWAWWE